VVVVVVALGFGWEALVAERPADEQEQ